MKTENEFLPKSLQALPALDFFTPKEPGDGGNGGAPLGPFDTVDFTMHGPVSATNYSELKMEAPADGGTTPINNGSDTERALLIMPLPKVGTAWTMSMQLGNAAGTDMVEMKVIDAKYAALRLTLANARNLKAEALGMYFTIQVAPTRFETYVNINQVTETLVLAYKDLNTFDAFRVSFLAKSNVQ